MPTATATPSTPPAPTTSRDESFSPLEWMQLHSRELTFAFVALVVIGGGVLFWKRSVAIKNERAEKAYFQSLRSVQAGNPQLALSDLQKVVTRYNGTAAAAQAAMSIAQIQYEAGKPAEGIKVLQQVGSSGSAKPFAASIEGLIADGLSNEGKFAEAAARYQAAAEKAEYKADKDLMRANAARALQAAGKGSDALKIWRELAADPESGQLAEANVRIGELLGKGVK